MSKLKFCCPLQEAALNAEYLRFNKCFLFGCRTSYTVPHGSDSLRLMRFACINVFHWFLQYQNVIKR